MVLFFFFKKKERKAYHFHGLAGLAGHGGVATDASHVLGQLLVENLADVAHFGIRRLLALLGRDLLQPLDDPFRTRRRKRKKETKKETKRKKEGSD